MGAFVEKIFIAPAGGAAMEAVEKIEALAGQGLRGDRYWKRAGYWSGTDECEVTLIEAEKLEEISSTIGLCIQDGQHRRNLVPRGLRLESLARKRFRVGEAVLEFDRPRPPRGLHSVAHRAGHDPGPAPARRHLRAGRPLGNDPRPGFH